MFAAVRNGAIIVAHPDDETLWFGGLMIRYPQRWTVICCSIPRVDPVRAYKFFDACDVLGARVRLLPFVESNPYEPLAHLEALDLDGFDCIATHNEIGEYGHRHHRDVHAHVARAAGGRLVAGRYGLPAGPAADQGTCAIQLSTAEMQIKRQALARYDHVSRSDDQPKSAALLARYGTMFDLSVETYERLHP